MCKCFVVVLVHFSFVCLSACFIKEGRKEGRALTVWGSGEEDQGGLGEGKCDQNILYKKRIQIKSFAQVF